MSYIVDSNRQRALFEAMRAAPEPPHPDCPHGDPMHDHGDGCPACDIEQCPACRCIRGKLAAGEDCPGCEDRFGGGM